jgi:aerobic-type carbon monoxide dehydrogenase small subunit (CoxS/CutS family)
MKCELELNGRKVELEGDPMARLLDVLREDAGLIGTKEGCGEGECGSCSILLDGDVVCSCLVPLFQVQGRKLRTVEGLERKGELNKLQEAFVTEGGVQCGACTPGILMTAQALLSSNSKPTREQIRVALGGNLCRCTGYERIFRAIEVAAGTSSRKDKA